MDYHARMRINNEDYWLLTPNESTAEKLPKAFFKEVYIRIHEWFGQRPQIQPLHVRDLLNPRNEVFSRRDFDSVEEDIEVVDLSVNEASIEGLDVTPNIHHIKGDTDVRDPPTDGEPFHGSPIRPVPLCSGSRQGPNPIGGVGASNGTPLHGGTPILKGSTVFLSDSSHSISKRKIANTVIRRKSSGGPTTLVEVVKASGKAIAIQMKEMASMTKETESNKLEVQL